MDWRKGASENMLINLNVGLHASFNNKSYKLETTRRWCCAMSMRQITRFSGQNNFRHEYVLLTVRYYPVDEKLPSGTRHADTGMVGGTVATLLRVWLGEVGRKSARLVATGEGEVLSLY